MCSCQSNHIRHAQILEPYLRYLTGISQTNSSMQKEEKPPSLASPTGSQKPKKLRSIKHEITHSGSIDDPKFPPCNDTSNTN